MRCIVTQMSNIVRIENARGRDIWAERGISVNSAYNGVGLERRVHYLTYSDRYVKAVNVAIQEFDNPDGIVKFLSDIARRLSDLNQYTGNKALLHNKFDELLISIEEMIK